VLGVGQSEGPEPYWLSYSDPDRSRCAEHEEVVEVCVGKWCARPTEYSYGRTTDAPAQGFNGANLRATLEVE
jgi:hypothetical protein